MKQPAFCCDQPPLIFKGHDAELHENFSVACMVCGRLEISRDREYAVHKFNKGVKEEKVENVQG